MAQLSMLESAWQYLFANYSPSTVVWAGTFLIHETAYFLISLVFFACDCIPYFKRWKIQQDKVNDGATQWRCLLYVLFQHVCVQLPMIVVFSPTMLDLLGMSVDLPFPTWRSIALNSLLCMVVEDFYFYWFHRLLHHRLLYKYIHKRHHDHTAPFGLAGEYAHPIETMFLGIGTVAGPLLFTRHLATLWVWLVVRVAQVVEAHSGYDFPWSPNRWLPFWGGAEYHDYHHRTSLGPYSSTFTYMDTLFGTNKQYLAEAKKKASKA